MDGVIPGQFIPREKVRLLSLLTGKAVSLMVGLRFAVGASGAFLAVGLWPTETLMILRRLRLFVREEA